MIRCLTFSLATVVSLNILAIPLRAANEPRGEDGQNHGGVDQPRPPETPTLGLLSIVGQPVTAEEETTAAPPRYVSAQDPVWYAEQAATLRDQLEGRQAQLCEYQQALDDARSLKDTTGGINLDEGDMAITPESGIEILRQRVNQTQTELDALEELARHHGIPPGALRGQ
jgi:hypothetical protein